MIRQENYIRHLEAALFMMLAFAVGFPTCCNAQTEGWNGWFSSEMTEIELPTKVAVTGKIPKWLRGTLLRTGSGDYEMGKRAYNHIFDGFAKVSRYHINASGVFFSTRFLETDIMKASKTKKDIAPHLCMQQPVPPFSHTKTMGVMLGPLDAANINIWRTGDQTYACCEQDITNTFDTDTLTMIGHTNYSTPNEGSGKTSSNISSSITLPRISGAHPSREVDGDATFRWSGEMVIDPLKKPSIEIYKDTQTSPGGKLTRTTIGSMQAEWLSILHSFPLTKNYVVIPQFPLGIKMAKALEKLSVMKAVGWMGDTKPAYIHVFDAHSTDANAGPVKTFKTDPFLSMHMINAWESVGKDGQTLVHFDCIGYNDGFLLTNPVTFGNLQVMKSPECCGNLGESFSGTIRRYTLDMSPEGGMTAANISTTKKPLSPPKPPPASLKVNFTRHRAYSTTVSAELLNEMPRINDEFHGKPYCYFYAGTGLPVHSPTMKDFHLTKVNMCGEGSNVENHTLDSLTWNAMNQYPSEGVFVQRPGAKREDDGVLMAPVLDGTKNQSYLLILDAKDMKEIARAQMPIRIPYDVHGQFFFE